MNKHITNPIKSSHKRHLKGTKPLTQLQKIDLYLKHNEATGSMIAVATGVPQKNICRRKRELEKAGLLWEIMRKRCKVTGYHAWYLTTDPGKAPTHISKQLNLF